MTTSRLRSRSQRSTYARSATCSTPKSSGKFSAADRCPRLQDQTRSRCRGQRQAAPRDTQTAELINRGTPAAPVKTGTDGGMNPTFLAAVKSHGGPGSKSARRSGTIPAHVNPPGEPAREAATGSTMSLASAKSKPAAAPRSSVQVASAAPTRRNRQLLRQPIRIEGGPAINPPGRERPKATKAEAGPRRDQATARGRRAQFVRSHRSRGSRSRRSMLRATKPQPAPTAASEHNAANTPATTQPAQRRAADGALRRLRKPLRRLALS